MTKAEVDACTILRATVGSVAMGYNLPGSGDRDEMGICIEPPKYVIGLNGFENYIERTAVQRAMSKGMSQEDAEKTKSQPGDLDLTVYSLRKFCKLAASGNPQVLTLLFVPDEMCSHRAFWGGTLRKELAPAFHSRQAVKAFAGYLIAQKMKLTGERGGRRKPSRLELIADYGFDTKFAMHMVRLGIQGVEFLRTGRLQIPMRPEDSQILRDIRVGKYKLDDCVEMAEQSLETMLELERDSDIPKKADYKRIQDFLIAAYESTWGSDYGSLAAHRFYFPDPRDPFAEAA